MEAPPPRSMAGGYVCTRRVRTRLFWRRGGCGTPSSAAARRYVSVGVHAEQLFIPFSGENRVEPSAADACAAPHQPSSAVDVGRRSVPVFRIQPTVVNIGGCSRRVSYDTSFTHAHAQAPPLHRTTIVWSGAVAPPPPLPGPCPSGIVPAIIDEDGSLRSRRTLPSYRRCYHQPCHHHHHPLQH